MFQEYLKKVREQSPIIHNITNYVTVNDCANILLACGASPIMADDINEVVDITSLCAGLNINIGTLNQNTIPSMFAAGRKANSMGHRWCWIRWGRALPGSVPIPHASCWMKSSLPSSGGTFRK